MLSDETVDQPHAECGGALRDRRRVLRAPGHAGNVQMRPGHAIGEALQEARGGDRTAGAPAHVLHVGDLALQHLVVGLAQRHAPQLLAPGGAGRLQVLRERLVVAEHPAVFMPERHDDAARERREIHHERWLEALLAVPHHIAQYEAALGVGVDDLDRLAGIAGHHVAGALGRAAGHVLDQADQPHHVHLRLAPGQGRHGADDRPGAGHVPLHVLHAARGLDGDAAGVERDALADEGEWLGLRPALLTLALSA